MRVLIRTSKLAIWARRLASFAAALIVISTGLHMFGQIGSDVFEISLVIGTGFALGAFVAGLIAWARLWFSGDKGWGPASIGVVVGMLCLGPAATTLAMTELYISTADVSTAFADPPPLLMARPNHPEIDPETVLASFPNLITRIYQIPPSALFSLGRELVEASGWDIVGIQPPGDAQAGAVNAIRRSLFGFENEIAFRVSPNPIGALIDLRAASMVPVRHDLGDNGREIERFLIALDDMVSRYIQNTMALIEPDDDLAPVEPGEQADAE